AAPVTRVTRVGVERLEVPDLAECRAPRPVTRRPHVHRFEEQRADLPAAPNVDQPRVQVGIVFPARDDTRLQEPRIQSVRQYIAVAERLQNPRVERERTRTPPRIDTHSVPILVDPPSPVTRCRTVPVLRDFRGGAALEGRTGVDAASGDASASAGRAAGGEV